MLAQRVLKNAVYNSSSILIANVVGIILTVYVARVLKEDLFGVYSLALSVAFLVLTFTDLGINATLIRYVAHSRKLGDYELVRGYIRGLLRLKLILVIATSAFLFLCSDFLSTYVFHKPFMTQPFRVVSAFVFFFSLSGFISSIFNAMNDFSANLLRAVVYELSRLLLVIFFIFIGLSVVGALLGFAVASFLSFAALTAMLVKKYPFIFGKAKSVEWKKIVRFTGYLTLGSISWVIFTYVDSVMIGILMPIEYVGYYRAAYNIVGAIAGVVSIPTVMFPVFVHLEGRDLKNAFDRVFKYSAVIAFPIAFGLPVISQPLIKFVYGEEYLAATGALWFLSFLILRSALGFWGVIFNAKEMPEYPVYVVSAAMLLNVVLNYVMIQYYGIIGASLATLVSNAFSWLTLAYLCNKMFKILPKLAHVAKPALASLVMCLILIQLDFSSFFSAIGVILLGAIIYFAVMFLCRGLTAEDVRYIRSLLTAR